MIYFIKNEIIEAHRYISYLYMYTLVSMTVRGTQLKILIDRKW